MHRARSRLLTISLVLAAGAAFLASRAFAAAPVLTVPGSQTVNEGTLLTFNVSATDADGQPLVFRASALPAGSTFHDNHNNTATFTWTPNFTQAGPYGPTFIADDTFGGVDAKGVIITVTNVNQAPVLDPIGDRDVERGTSLGIFVSGSDADDDPLTFSTQNLPAWATFTDFGGGMAMLQLTPPGNMTPGSTSMTVRLTDGMATVSETFSINVYSVGSSNPPVMAPIANPTVAEGSTASVNASATDADGETLTWTVSLPGFATFTSTGSGPGAASGTVAMAPGYCDAGTYAASLGASDGSTTDTKNFTITVTNVNRAPTWALPMGGYAMTLAEGGSADLSVHASDPDQACGLAAPSLAYPGGAPSSLAVTLTDQTSGNGNLHVAANYDAAGTYNLTLRASDGSLTTDVSVRVTVTATNRAPVADAGGPYSGLQNTAIAMSGAGSSDPDGDALSYSWNFGDGGAGSGVSVTHTYATFGHFTVVLTASDGSLSDMDSTGADVRSGYLARAFTDHATIRLKTGKPRETVYLEPVGGSFSVDAVDLSSLRLAGPDGLGSVPTITPIDGSVVVGGDSDRNRVAEVAMDFSKDDLRSLFTNLDKDMQATLVLTANLNGGGSVRATLGWAVEPERKLVARIQPNPMNPAATVRVNLETGERLSIRFYDLNGRLVRVLMENVDTPAGVHDYLFDGKNAAGQTLPTGQYFYKAETPTARTSGTVMILK